MATKKVKVEATTTIDFSNSIEKIKGSAKTVNTEVVDTAIEVLEDLRTNGAQIRAVATAKVKEAIENVTIGNGVKLVKNTTKSIHQYNIETAEEIIEATVDGSKAVQNFIAKSLLYTSNSSAPMSGLLTFLDSPSKSSVIPTLSPAAINSQAPACRSVKLLKYGSTETELLL